MCISLVKFVYWMGICDGPNLFKPSLRLFDMNFRKINIRKLAKTFNSDKQSCRVQFSEKTEIEWLEMYERIGRHMPSKDPPGSISLFVSTSGSLICSTLV